MKIICNKCRCFSLVKLFSSFPLSILTLLSTRRSFFHFIYKKNRLGCDPRELCAKKNIHVMLKYENNHCDSLKLQCHRPAVRMEGCLRSVRQVFSYLCEFSLLHLHGSDTENLSTIKKWMDPARNEHRICLFQLTYLNMITLTVMATWH